MASSFRLFTWPNLIKVNAIVKQKYQVNRDSDGYCLRLTIKKRTIKIWTDIEDQPWERIESIRAEVMCSMIKPSFFLAKEVIH